MPSDLDSLAQLRDIHLPEPISAWLLAPGWYLLALLLLLTLGGLAVWYYRYCIRTRVKKLALRRVHVLQQQYQETKQVKALIAELSTLLRRVALAYFPREDIAGLYGEQWLLFLQESGQNCAFTGAGAALITAPYQAQAIDDMQPLFELCLRWIKQRK